jgi:aminoglycoside 3-N-acetyltransferase
MSEADAVASADAPRTRASLTADLRALGVAAGETLLVHSSLRALGWVCGGPVAVVQALLDALAPGGTLVMPTHTGDLSEPAHWSRPPVPEAWWPIIRETMPAFDPRVTPTRSMGAIVEVFRTWPGGLRSAHPQVSFAALGPQAEWITAGHALGDALGDSSPLGRIYALAGSVLLLGVGYGNNTSFHLAEYRVAEYRVAEYRVAEYRAPGGRRITEGAPILVDGRRVWQTWDDLDFDAEPFPAIGAAFEASGAVRVGRVGSAEARLFPQRAAVDFATAWLRRERGTD